ncbi:protein AATF-like [Scleropages formosus]|uniref:Protein AATF-like n=1 Tax=Scleropages formosus TaxID=113540 RepID=A0A0P7Y197_SCLFO|nr:protein AATF-like [Scleropages formosus]
MAASISQQLEELLNPLPTFLDPEDDQDEETKAKVVEKFNEGENEDEDGAVSGLRKRASALLSETDRRYWGKATSREKLRREAEGSGMESEELEEDDMEEEDDGDGDTCDDEDDGEEEEDESVAGSDEDSPQMKTLVKKMKGADITFPSETDFHKLTEGMDDIGDSEDEEDEEDDEEGDTGDEEDEDESDVHDDEGDEEMEKGDADKDDSDVMTFYKDKVDEEVEKGKAVKNQLALWDQLLEGRIKLQKALVTANQLPQPQTFPLFKTRGGADFTGALKNSHKALKALQRSLMELQDLLFHQNPDTRPIALGKAATRSEDEEEHSDQEGEEESVAQEQRQTLPKRKMAMVDYPDFMAKRFVAFQPYRDATLQKWHDKTRLAMGKTGKGFAAFDRNILTQVEQVLTDSERLIRRTQTKRSEYRILGKPDTDSAPVPTPASGEGEEVGLKANIHLKDVDEEIFDDDDFYHQLLRELIERKTSAVDPNDQVAMGRQWLTIQKLRSKIKKKVDTKASKGRKVRFHVHSKLVNFMAPIDHDSMNDDAR